MEENNALIWSKLKGQRDGREGEGDSQNATLYSRIFLFVCFFMVGWGGGWSGCLFNGRWLIHVLDEDIIMDDVHINVVSKRHKDTFCTFWFTLYFRTVLFSGGICPWIPLKALYSKDALELIVFCFFYLYYLKVWTTTKIFRYHYCQDASLTYNLISDRTVFHALCFSKSLRSKVTGACVLVARRGYMASRAANHEELWCLCSKGRWKQENTISLNSQLSRLIGILPDDSASISELLQAHKQIHSAVTQNESGHLTQTVIKPKVLVKLLIEPCSRHRSPPIRCCLLYLLVYYEVITPTL